MILANSNPATIMTDPATADRTYVEPLDPDVLDGDHREGAARRAAADPRRADRAEPDHGARRARACSSATASRSSAPGPRRSRRPRTGTASRRRCRTSASRCPARASPTRCDEAEEIADDIGFPIMVRPSFILGGKGTGIAEDAERVRASWPPTGLAASPVGQILVEQSIAGWKEFELEVMRDGAGQLRRRLLHRELRPHGRAHRRLHHRGPGADPDRRGVPGHARRRLRLPAPGRGRDGRLQRAVRRRPGDGAAPRSSR